MKVTHRKVTKRLVFSENGYDYVFEEGKYVSCVPALDKDDFYAVIADHAQWWRFPKEYLSEETFDEVPYEETTSGWLLKKQTVADAITQSEITDDLANNLAIWRDLFKGTKKFFVVYLDSSYKNETDVLFSYDETERRLKAGYDLIKTTSLATLSFDLYQDGYELFIVRNNRMIKIYPGMDNPRNKDIRIQHNLRKLVLGGFFDNMFNDKRFYIELTK